MLVDDLPAAVALALEDVGEARADRGPQRRRPLTVKTSVPELTKASGTDDLNVPVGDVVIGRLHADECLRPAGLDLAVGARRRVGRVDHHRAVGILAHDGLDVAGGEARLRALRDCARLCLGDGRMVRCCWRQPAERQRARNSASRRATARSSGLLQMLAAEQLGDLDGVQRRALAEVVADHPQAEAVIDRRSPRGCG